jgi:asparagine synthase (glutamine-hydrolysing)
MCGIAGVVFKNGHRPNDTLLESISEKLKQRGPDAKGLFVHENIALIHRRLKILDLSDRANQPLHSADGKIHLVFNGEIYNFNELKTDLRSKGAVFSTTSDSEVVLKAYEEWGTGAFAKFNGMFAIGIYDQKKSSLILARDRFGVKPLFYTKNGEEFAFASLLTALLPLPFLDRKISKDSVLSFHKFGHIPHPHTILQSVKQLEPGNYLEFSKGNIRIENFVALEQLDPLNISFEEAKVALWDKIIKSVRIQSVSDVPIGCFLSGGIDSSLIASAYAKSSNASLNTFSIGFKESNFDESQHAQSVARALGSTHREFMFSSEDFLRFLPEVSTQLDQPFADPSFLPALLLSRETKKEVSVCFSGDGGDEYFFGYPHQALLLKLQPVFNLPSNLRKTIANGLCISIQALQRLYPTIQLAQLIKLLENLQFNEANEFYQNFVGMIGPLKRTRLNQLIPGANVIDTISPILHENISISEKIEQIFQKTFLIDTALAKTDRASMAYGLEGRVPFLENDLVNFSKRIPLSFKYQGSQKRILREILRDQLPKDLGDSIIDRKKQGFQLPIRDWLRNERKDLLEVLRSEDNEFYDKKLLGEIIDEHLKEYQNHSHLLWAMICFSQWMKCHKI